VDDRSGYMGTNFATARSASSGSAASAKALVKLLAGFGMKPPPVYDPFLSKADAIRHGVNLVPIDWLLGEADFVSIHCPLTEQTQNLIGERELA